MKRAWGLSGVLREQTSSPQGASVAPMVRLRPNAVLAEPADPRPDATAPAHPASEIID
jgi:hypothetical protein